MRIITSITLFVFSLVLLSACGPTLDEARVRFCEELGAYGQAVVQLRQLDETSTVDDLNQAQVAVADSWKELQSAAANLQEAQIAELQQANDTLSNTVNSISGEATLGEAGATVRQATLETMAAYNDIMTTTCMYGQQ